MIKSLRASSIASSSGGAWYSASARFQRRLARTAASSEPAASHFSNGSLSAISLVPERGLVVRPAYAAHAEEVAARPHLLEARPAPAGCRPPSPRRDRCAARRRNPRPSRTSRRTSESSPSRKPAECRMKLAPQCTAASIDIVPSFIACASGSFDVVSSCREQRSGRLSRRAELPDHHRADRRLRRAEGRRSRAQRHRRQEVAEDHRRARPLELRERTAGHASPQATAQSRRRWSPVPSRRRG